MDNTSPKQEEPTQMLRKRIEARIEVFQKVDGIATTTANVNWVEGYVQCLQEILRWLEETAPITTQEAPQEIVKQRMEEWADFFTDKANYIINNIGGDWTRTILHQKLVEAFIEVAVKAGSYATPQPLHRK
jgi:hypothetical protein